MTVQEHKDDPVIIVCAGPPACDLEGDDAVAAQRVGCRLCKRIIVHDDESETVIEATRH